MLAKSIQSHLLSTFALFAGFSGLAACDSVGGNKSEVSKSEVKAVTEQKGRVMSNRVFHFEIPVTDLTRAIAFYEDVLQLKLERQAVDGYEMAFFPRSPDKPGASGALAKGDVYVPSKNGSLIYFDVPDIDPVIERATKRGAKVLYPKKFIGEGGYVAEIEDSEGNRLALSALAD